MSFVAMLLLAGGGGALCALLFKKDFGRALPLFVLAALAVLYLAGLLGRLWLGVWAVLLAAAAGLALAVCGILQAKRRGAVLKRFTGFPAFAFVFLLALVWVVNIGRNLTASDEFNFWAPMVKETLRLNALHTARGAVVGLHREYAPGMTLLQYLWCRLAGGYSEPEVYRATQFFSLVFLLPLFSGLQNRAWPFKAGALALAVTLTFPASDPLFEFIHLDATLGILLGYVLFSLTEDSAPSLFGALNLGLACFAVCLVKQMGLFAAVLSGGWLVADVLARRFLARRPPLPPQGRRAALRWAGLRLALVLGGVLLAHFSWSLHLGAADISAGAYTVGSVSPGGALQLLLGRADGNAQFVAYLFAKAMLERPVFTTRFFGAAYLPLVLVLTAAAFGLWRVFRKEAGSTRLLALAITVPLGAAAYAAVMLLLYVYSFAPDDAWNMAAFERYMGSYAIAALTALLMIYLPPLATRAAPTGGKRAVLGFCALVLAWLLLGFPGGRYYTQLAPHTRRDDVYAPHAAAATALRAVVDPCADKVYIIDQSGPPLPGHELIAFWYYGSPLVTNRSGINVGQAHTAAAQEEGGAPPSLAEWRKTLANGGYTRVFLYRLGGNLDAEFAHLFGGGPKEGGLYRVQTQAGELRLVFERALI